MIEWCQTVNNSNDTMKLFCERSTFQQQIYYS